MYNVKRVLRGRQWNPSLVWTKQWNQVWKHPCCTCTSLIFLHFPETFQWTCLRFDGCFAISSISVFVNLFLLVLSGLFWNPPLLLSFSQVFLFRHDFKSPLNLSSASQIGGIFLSLIHFLFLHKHICSSEWVGIVVFLKKGMLSFNQAHYSCPMVQSCLCLSKRTGE